LIHALATRGRKKGGEKLHCIPRTYPKSQGGACAFLLHFWLLGGVVCCTKSVSPILVTGLTNFGNRLDRFGGTGLTGFGNQPDRFVPESALVQGEYAYVQGELLYALVVCAFSLSMVLSRMCRAVSLA
jgi:hypothetical protein